MVGDIMLYLFNQNGNINDFLSTSGIGVLNDATTAEVTEERNGAYDLEIEYPISGSHYSDIQNGFIILAPVYPKCPRSYYQAFRIYHISQPFNGIVKISAHHISYDLNKMICRPWNIPANDLESALSNLQQGICNPTESMGESMITSFEFRKGPDKNNVDATMELPFPKTARSILGGEENSILDIYRGEYEFDNFTVKLHNNRGRSDSGISVIYRKNLSDFSKEDDSDSVYDGVYPFYYSENTETNEAGEETTSKILVQINDDDSSQDPYILYGEDEEDEDESELKMIKKPLYLLDLSSEFEYVPTPNELREKAKEYMAVNKLNLKNISFTVSFEDLENSTDYEKYRNFESIRLCDYVTIYTPAVFGNSRFTAECTRIVYDILSDKYNSIELGNASHYISDTIAKTAKDVKNSSVTKSQAESMMDSKITSLMNNGNGGYVMFHRSRSADTDEDLPRSAPDEILIMDKPSLSESTSVWRWNKNGLGYSNNPSNLDSYSIALLSDGSINAEMIRGKILTGTSIQLYDSTTIGDGNRTGTYIDDDEFSLYYQGDKALTVQRGQSILTRLQIQNDTEFGGKVRFQPVSNGLDIIFLEGDDD